MPSYVALAPGDPAPWFKQRTCSNPRYSFDSAAGRYIVLGFFASAGDPHSRDALSAITARRAAFDDDRACFFGVSVDPRDESEGRIADSMPGLRYFFDFDGQVSRLYGSLPIDPEDGKEVQARRFWAVLDPFLRVISVIPFGPGQDHCDRLMATLAALPPPERAAGFPVPAPVLVLPNLFEPELCERLIGLYEAGGGHESGFMREVDGKTVLMHDPSHKRRRDQDVEDPDLKRLIQGRILKRVVPQIAKAFQFQVTRMERYIVCCYDAADGAHFRAHRDNTTKGTAHRRFALSINLNAAFEGGEISFPEFGRTSYKPPPGGGVVFSCSLLHAVSTVTSGRRFAFLPFLYDDAAARVREANNAHLGEGVRGYQTV